MGTRRREGGDRGGRKGRGGGGGSCFGRVVCGARLGKRASTAETTAELSGAPGRGGGKGRVRAPNKLFSLLYRIPFHHLGWFSWSVWIYFVSRGAWHTLS